jgi:hypothetical protein
MTNLKIGYIEQKALPDGLRNKKAELINTMAMPVIKMIPIQ